MLTHWQQSSTQRVVYLRMTMTFVSLSETGSGAPNLEFNFAATVDEHLQKVGAEAFNRFQRYITHAFGTYLTKLSHCLQTYHKFRH